VVIRGDYYKQSSQIRNYFNQTAKLLSALSSFYPEDETPEFSETSVPSTRLSSQMIKFRFYLSTLKTETAGCSETSVPSTRLSSQIIKFPFYLSNLKTETAGCSETSVPSTRLNIQIIKFPFYLSTLKTETAGCSETSVLFYQTKRQNIPEHIKLHSP
jgi:hypothetical protein